MAISMHQIFTRSAHRFVEQNKHPYKCTCTSICLLSVWPCSCPWGLGLQVPAHMPVRGAHQLCVHGMWKVCYEHEH